MTQTSYNQAANGSEEDQNATETKATAFKCPSCGGVMVFNPASQNLKCEYCEYSMNMEDSNQQISGNEFDDETELSKGDVWNSQSHAVKCKNCGATTISQAFIVSDKCTFCGTANVLEEVILTGLSPEYVVPFKISEKTAISEFRKWVKRRWFAPNKLKKTIDGTRVDLTGLYVPCWSFDTDTSSFYTAMAGEHYYVTVTDTVVKDGKTEHVTRQEQRTRWYPVSGQYYEDFRDYIVDSSVNIDDNMMDKILPYNMSELVPFKPEYLSGFKAERYSVSLKEGWKLAKQRLAYSIERGIIRQINADEVSNVRFKTSYGNKHFKHILLPTWYSSFKYNNKSYAFMINGQTGRVAGRSPISPWKVTALVVGIAVVAVIGYFVYTNFIV